MTAHYDEETTSEVLLRTPRKGIPTPVRGAPARIVVLAGEQPGRKFQVHGEALVGRVPEAAIRLEDSQISRRHALVRREGEGFVVEDLGSRNGTSVNGVPLQQPQPVAFGDRIQLGDRTVLLFTHHDPLEEHLLQRQKMEALGRLGTGIAHDFNNLLGAVLSSLDYVEGLPTQRRLDDGAVRESLSDIRAAATRAAELTSRLLGFARQRSLEQGPVDLTALCREVAQLARRTFDQSVRINVSMPPGLTVTGDRSQLHQLFMNLSINARDAMPHGGKLRVRGLHQSSEDLQGLPLPARGDYVMIEVEDTGLGMDAETRRHAFEPFFTTKATRESGAGLGLATAYEVVTSHGGHMTLDSAPGRGTTFRVYLPATRATQVTRIPPRPTPPPVERAPSDGALILLADDQDVVRRSAGRLIRHMGHDVSYARDGREALDIYQGASRRPDLVLLDLDMPRVGGEETYRLLRRVDPDVRVVFVSGYWEDSRERELSRQGALAFVRKPYDGETLRNVIDMALRAGQRRHDS